MDPSHKGLGKDKVDEMLLLLLRALPFEEDRVDLLVTLDVDDDPPARVDGDLFPSQRLGREVPLHSDRRLPLGDSNILCHA